MKKHEKHQRPKLIIESEESKDNFVELEFIENNYLNILVVRDEQGGCVNLEKNQIEQLKNFLNQL